MKHRFTLIALPLLLSLIACASIEEKHYSKERYAPTTKNQVMVLNDFPDRPYKEIGEIKGIGSVVYQSASDVGDDIREAAAAMGADAIILKGNGKVDYDFFQGVSTKRKAIAIKWTAPEGTKIQKSVEPSLPANSLPTPEPVK